MAMAMGMGQREHMLHNLTQKSKGFAGVIVQKWMKDLAQRRKGAKVRAGRGTTTSTKSTKSIHCLRHLCFPPNVNSYLQAIYPK